MLSRANALKAGFKNRGIYILSLPPETVTSQGRHVRSVGVSSPAVPNAARTGAFPLQGCTTQGCERRTASVDTASWLELPLGIKETQR